jgi:predicted  nucleic acid-binding Zn-ribbon protein
VVTADPAIQIRLLDLQAIDTVVAQLAHRRRALPELGTIADSTARLTELHNEAVGFETQLSDIASEQRRLENDIDVVRSREERDQKRLASGGIPAKELEGLQHELQSLARRQSTLEDAALEVMEKREELESQLAEVQSTQAEVTAARSAAEQTRDAAWADIDAQVAEKIVQRRTVEAEMPEELLSLYDKVREAQGGVGAAALRHRRCEGCRLELAGSELSAVRSAAPDEVVRCENCRRILVRTPESGL